MPHLPLDYSSPDPFAAGGSRYKLAYACFVIGIVVTPAAVIAVAGVWAAEYQWQWLAGLLFPHALLLWQADIDPDVAMVIALAQFPIYGVVLAGAALVTRAALRRWLRILGMTHFLVAAAALATSWARAAI
jgi:hypothetical protein